MIKTIPRLLGIEFSGVKSVISNDGFSNLYLPFMPLRPAVIIAAKG